MFLQYLEKGIIVIPERNGMPLIKWAKIAKNGEIPERDVVETWDKIDKVGYGLITGIASKIIALDIDVDDQEDINFITKRLGDTPCKKFGTKGITLFYKYNGEAQKNYIKDKKVFAELKSTGGKVTIPPSAHYSKKGVSYTWKGKPLLECYEALPKLPANYNDIINAAFNIIERTEPVINYNQAKYYGEVDEGVVEDALSYISPDISYSEWKAVGASLYDEFGDAGFSLFNDWSSKGSKYESSEIRMQWKGCASFNNYSIGTLFFMAKEAGFKMPSYKEQEVSISTLEVADYGKKPTEKSLDEAMEEDKKIPDFVLEAPEHIRKICDWYNKSAYFKQPTLAFGACLASLGFIMGKDYQFKGKTGNLYFAGLADTGMGKETILRCSQSLIAKAGLGKDNTAAEFTSIAAICQVLKRTPDFYSAFITDELQSIIGSLASSNKASEEAKTAAFLLRLYTNKVVEGKVYANKKDTEEKGGIFEDPFVSIIGFSTPDSFFSAMGQAEASSGLVGRLTVFKGSRFIHESNPDYDDRLASNPPAEIVEIVKKIRNKSITGHHKGYALRDYINPVLTPEAKQYLDDYETQWLRKRNQMKMDGDKNEFLFVRVYEQIKKYCLIGSLGEIIDLKIAIWARAVAEYNIQVMSEAVSHFADNKWQSQLIKTQNYIIGRGVVSRTQLNNNLRIFESRKEREEIIAELVERGAIKLVKAPDSKAIAYQAV